MGTSAGHLVVRTLETHGVERVYAVPGESYLDVLDGLHDSAISTIVCRHEGGAAFMALAEGRLTGRPGIAMVTRGPGAANAVIAVHTAWQDGTAMVLFVGLIPTADRGRDSFQEFSLEGWFTSTAKRVLLLDDPARGGEIVAEAMRIAASGRPGPVVVGLPEDVLVRHGDAAPVLPRALASPRPSAAETAELGARLSAAERPLLVVGGDGWHGDTGARLMAFAEAARVPVAADWRAYDAVPHEHPAWAGWLGYGRADTLAAYLDEADLLVFLGCVRGDVLSEGFAAGLDAETVLITPDPEARMHAGRIDQHILAAPARAVGSLPDADAVRGGRDGTWMRRLAAEQRRFSTPAPATQELDLQEVGGILERELEPDRVMTYGAGNATIWGHRFISHNSPGSLVAPRNGAMGLAVPAAVAAGLVSAGRRVVAFCGDGDFLMTGQELAVAVEHGLAPLVVVVDNGVYGTIVQHQRRQYPGRPEGTAFANPDFVAWMRSFGGHGELVERTRDFLPALRRALDSRVPALLHLKVPADVMSPGTGNEAGEERT